MANIYRNILTVFGPLDEADRFVGRFVPGGMEAVMPIPADAKPNRRYSEIWGSVPDGLDLEVLTENSIVAVEVGNAARPRIRDISGNWVNYNTFTLADMDKEIAANDLPGFVGGEPRAVLVFHTKWVMPIRWIEFVINTEYDHGLSFHMQGYDVMANSGAHRQTESGECISECNH